MSDRQLQRQIAAVEGVGLIKRIGRTSRGEGKTSNEYDLTAPVNTIEELEPQRAKAKEEARAQSNALPAQHKRTAWSCGGVR